MTPVRARLKRVKLYCASLRNKTRHAASLDYPGFWRLLAGLETDLRHRLPMSRGPRTV